MLLLFHSATVLPVLFLNLRNVLLFNDSMHLLFMFSSDFVIVCFHVLGESASWMVCTCGGVGWGRTNNVPLHTYLMLRYWMFTCMFPKIGLPEIIHPNRIFMDFPWNKPSSYWGTPIYGNPHLDVFHPPAADLRLPSVTVLTKASSAGWRHARRIRPRPQFRAHWKPMKPFLSWWFNGDLMVI